jgi:MFS family permease
MASAQQWTRAEKLLLAVLSGVVCLDALDASLTQVALPSIGTSLGLGEARLQWIVSAYVLGYGGFLLLGGRCADVFGRRRVLVWGLVALILASAIGTVASDGTLLIAARFVKGVSAAFTAPAALSIITTSFAEGPHRNKALGLFTAAAAFGFTFGLVSGGLLTQLSWRYTFAVVVPAAALLLLATLRVIRADSPAPEGAGARLDIGGAVTVTGAALIFVWAVVEAPSAGWTSGRTLGALAVVSALVITFVMIESRVEQPLVRFALLRATPLLRANVCALLMFGCVVVFNVSTTLYEQDVLGWGPLKAGIVFTVAGVSTGVVAPRVGAIATRVGAMWVLLAGTLASLAAYLLWLRTGTTTSYPVIVASLILAGGGFALAYPALNMQALAGVPHDEQGLASGLVGSSFQIGGALMLAIATAVALAHTPVHPSAQESVHGLHAGMTVAVAGAGLIALITVAGLLMRRREEIASAKPSRAT